MLVNTTNYILKNYCDIQQFPVAKGDMRALQRADTLLLAIVDEILRKNGFTYWIDAGTCLGAVRHKGFIPWDDDMDICMMRDEYEEALKVLPAIFSCTESSSQCSMTARCRMPGYPFCLASISEWSSR